MADINAQRLQLDLPPVEFSQIWIHFAHRVGALLVAVVTLLSVRHVFVNFTTERAMREPALVLFVLVVMQVLLGALTVWTGKNIETATAHVATGALLLGTSVVLSLRSYHLFRPAPAPVRTSLIPEGERA
jgi:cytochrome c oxidase assembly protein subunit 15